MLDNLCTIHRQKSCYFKKKISWFLVQNQQDCFNFAGLFVNQKLGLRCPVTGAFRYLLLQLRYWSNVVNISDNRYSGLGSGYEVWKTFRANISCTNPGITTGGKNLYTHVNFASAHNPQTWDLFYRNIVEEVNGILKRTLVIDTLKVLQPILYHTLLDWCARPDTAGTLWNG